MSITTKVIDLRQCDIRTLTLQQLGSRLHLVTDEYRHLLTLVQENRNMRQALEAELERRTCVIG